MDPALWRATLPTAPPRQTGSPGWRQVGFVAALALGLVLITGLPYLLAHALPFPRSRFNGNLVYDEDFNSYFAYMRQAARGQRLFHDPFTPEPHGNVFFNLEWLLAGKVAAVFGGSLEGALQVERLAGTFGVCFAFYWLTCRSLLARYRIRYVFWDSRERSSSSFDLAASPYLQEVFRNDAAAIYQVRKDRLY